MGLRQKIWAAKKRLTLIQKLGGICVKCGELDTNKLQFDHIQEHARTWVAKDTDPSWRMSIYTREIAEGKIQLLCGDCNKKKHHAAAPPFKKFVYEKRAAA